MMTTPCTTSVKSPQGQVSMSLLESRSLHVHYVRGDLRLAGQVRVFEWNGEA